jgi:hypothetical protein
VIKSDEILFLSPFPWHIAISCHSKSVYLMRNDNNSVKRIPVP